LEGVAFTFEYSLLTLILEDDESRQRVPETNTEILKNPRGREEEEMKMEVSKCFERDLLPMEWDEVIGQSQAKEALREAVEFPFKYPWFFNGRVNPPQGVLLYGPPGVAKTRLAYIAASVSKVPFVQLKGSDILSKWRGDSEKFINMLFKEIKAVQKAVIFIDEVDGIMHERGESNNSDKKIVNEFLVNLSGNQPGQTWFVLIGATNFPSAIDKSIKRRFQRQVRLQMPSEADRKDIFRYYFQSTKQSFEDTELTQFSAISSGYNALFF